MCGAHLRAHAQAALSTTEKGYDGAWRRLRNHFRRALCVECGGDRMNANCLRCGGSGLANRLCAECLAEGKMVLAREVDHILSIQDRPDLRLRTENLQVICPVHHGRKTNAEAHGLPLSFFQQGQLARAVERLGRTAA